LGGLCVGALYIYLRYVKPWSKGSSKKDYEREKLKKQFTLIVNQNGDDKNDPKSDDKGPFWN
jgi:hypothetical protein